MNTTTDRPYIGILLMLSFCVLAPLADAIAKLIGNSVPITQVVAIRFGAQVIILAPLIWWSGRAWRMTGRVLRLTVLRTVLHVVGIAAMFAALTHLPLADAIAIAFVMPFILLLLGKFVLGETVGPRRLWACAVGFLGTLLVVQPSFVAAGWPALLPLVVAVVFALFMLTGRQIAAEVDPVSLQAVSGCIAIILILPVLILGQLVSLPALDWIAPTTDQWQLLVTLGGLGTLAHLLMTWALKFAPAATLAPMQYLEIPFATIIGLLVFGDWPNPLASIGIVVTMSAGLYIILCERANARRQAVVSPPPGPPAGAQVKSAAYGAP